MMRYRERVVALQEIIRRHPGATEFSPPSPEGRFPQYEDGAFHSAHPDLLEWSKQVVEASKRWTPPDSAGRSILAPSLFRYYSSGEFGVPGARNAGIGNAYWISLLVNLSFLADSVWLPDPTEMIARAHSAIPEVYWSQGMLNSGEISDLIFEAMLVLERIQPLIDAGVVRLFPAVRLYEEAVASRLLGEVRSFSSAEMAASWPHGVVAEGLIFSSELGASYAALAEEEMESMLLAVTRTGTQISGPAPYQAIRYPRWPFVQVTDDSILDVLDFRLNSDSLNLLRQRLSHCGDLLTQPGQLKQAGQDLSLAFRDVTRDRLFRSLLKRHGPLVGSVLLGCFGAFAPGAPLWVNALTAGAIAGASFKLGQAAGPASPRLRLEPTYLTLGAPRHLMKQTWFSSQPAEMFHFWNAVSRLRQEFLVERRRHKPIRGRRAIVQVARGKPTSGRHNNGT